MASRQFKIRGLRGSIPGGYVLGRTGNGKGDAQLISLAELGQNIVSVVAASGGSGGGPTSTTLSALTDVSISTPLNSQSLVYSTSLGKWFNTYSGVQKSWHQLCVVAASAPLAACTYANGSSGDGATLTGSANGALTIDGTTSPTFTTGDRVLIAGQADAKQNGIYVITQLGDGSHPFILTRAEDFNNTAMLAAWSSVTFCIPVAGGTANATSVWMFTGTLGTGLTFGTATFFFAQIAGTSIPAANIAAIAAHTFLGNNTAGSASPTALTATQATAELNALVGDSGSGGTKGLAPAPAAGDAAAGKFLKANGTYAVPAGTGVAGSNALYAPVMSALPTISSTGLSTWVNQGSASVADNAVGMTITQVAAGTNDTWALRTKAAPGSTPYTFTALVAVSYQGGSIGGALLGWYDGTNKFQGIRLISNSGSLGIFVSDYNTPAAGFAGNHIGPASAGPFMWLRINNDGTNVTFSASADGVNFSTAYTIAKASGFLGASGYSNICFGCEANAVTGYGTIMSWAQT